MRMLDSSAVRDTSERPESGHEKPWPFALVTLDSEGRLAHVNREAITLLGLDADPATGIPFQSFIALAGEGDFAVFLLRCASASVPVTVEGQLLTPRRAGRWVLLTGVASATGYQIQCADIDTQKAERDKLLHREQRLEHALNAARQGIWDHDMLTGRVYFSDMWRKMRGYEPDEDVEALSGPWLERLHPDDRPRIEQAINKQNDGSLAVNAFEYRERHRNGHWMWILSRGSPIEWLPDGSVARILGTDTDITSLKEIEANLEEEKERLQVTLRSIGDGVIATDRAGRVNLINGAAEVLIGKHGDQAVGLSLSDILDLRVGTGGNLVAEMAERCLATALTVTLPEETVLARPDRTICLQCSISPVLAHSGEVIGLVTVFRDTTAEIGVKRALAYSASHDPLTGLSNRAAFDSALAEALASAHAEGREHVLCFLDLDDFKPVNDLHGHAAGDIVLQRVAELLTAQCRAKDFVGRLGGDEFVILLQDCSLARARSIGDRIVSKLARMVFDFGDASLSIGASMGLSEITRNIASTAIVREHADAACYKAKARGKGRIETL